MQFDLWTDWDPNWVMAVLSLPTLLAATLAGFFAWRAAHWTKQQSIAAEAQVEIAKEGLRVARRDADLARADSLFQRSETDIANRRQSEMRLDILAPAVLARAAPKGPTYRALEWRRRASEGLTVADWVVVDQPFTLQDNEAAEFRTVLNLTFRNVSNQIAVVDVVDVQLGEIQGVRQGDSITIAPLEERTFQWVRVLRSQDLSTQDQIDDPARWLFNLEFWVRDIGMNVRDTYKFNSDLRYFSRRGQALQVVPDPAFPWFENFAGLSQPRMYERLDLLNPAN